LKTSKQEKCLPESNFSAFTSDKDLCNLETKVLSKFSLPVNDLSTTIGFLLNFLNVQSFCQLAVLKIVAKGTLPSKQEKCLPESNFSAFPSDKDLCNLETKVFFTKNF
jgi:hypothetical protein